MSAEYTIRSDVMAAHINAIMRRICQIVRCCPAVSCSTVVNVWGYSAHGKKATLPTVAGFLPLLSPVHATTAQTVLIAPSIAQALPASAFDQRSARTISTQVQSAAIDNSESWTGTMAPAYGLYGLQVPPVVLILGAKTMSSPASSYTRTGTYVSTKPVTANGYDYEDDDLALTAWISPDGVEED